MSEARERALAFVRARRLLQPGESALVGTGGGARSLGLVALLASAREELELGRLAVAAVEPTLDDEDDAAEVIADVGRLVRDLGMDFHAVRPCPTRTRRADVPRELLALAREQGFDRVCLGNTLTDDAVRVLCELSLGGADRVRGIAPRVRGGIVRPFLVLDDAEAMAFAPAETRGWGRGVTPPDPHEEAVRKGVLPRLQVEFSSAALHLQDFGRRCRQRRLARRQRRGGASGG